MIPIVIQSKRKPTTKQRKTRVDEGLSKKVTFMAGVTEEDEDVELSKPILKAEEVEKSLLSDPSLSFITGLSDFQGKA